MHLPIEEQYLHQVNIMLLELDLRILLYFLSKTMFELLYILQNWLFSPHCVIIKNAIFSLIVWSDVASGQFPGGYFGVKRIEMAVRNPRKLP